ncbi:uncharacterized protein LOC129600463 [Paramacrobiotus metropolitanus]|uniref:uncharacterized protein LOC129600463 n=1 Tax=Paramacrobiotus metropolitanus TaxID=2943436 RepID=UPI0024462F0A|nr:uncharacterized protein LOC129600463 [Paramacrobiotus metropolitanus]
MPAESSAPKTLRISVTPHDNLPQEPAEDAPVVLLGEAIERFRTYAEYLNSQISEEDMFYLGDHRMAQKIVEQGLHNNREKFTRKTFEREQVAAAERRRLEREEHQNKITATFTAIQEDCVLQELVRRKDANENGQLLTIIFIRTRSTKGQEISGYVDYAHRLKTDKTWKEVFSGRRTLAPRPSDLSYFNWDTLESTLNDTPNFQVIIGKDLSVHFRCQKDFRIVNVNSQAKNNSDALSTVLRSKKYVQIVLYDHWIRLWSPEDEAMDFASAPLESAQTEPDLVDNVSAAILEEDLVEIAKNALGRPRRTLKGLPTVTERENILGQAQQFQENLAATLRTVRDIEQTDVRNETLGTFTYADLMEKLKKLLPANVTQERLISSTIAATPKQSAVTEEPQSENIEIDEDAVSPFLPQPQEFAPVMHQYQKHSVNKKTIVFNQLAYPVSGILTETARLERDTPESEKMLNPLYRKSQVSTRVRSGPYQHLKNNILQAFVNHRTPE